MVGRTTLVVRQVNAREAAVELLRLAGVARRMQFCDGGASVGLRTHRLGRARELLAEARRLREQFCPLP